MESVEDLLADISNSVDSDIKAFCLDDLTFDYFRELLSHLNIATHNDMSVKRMKELLLFSSVYVEKFESYQISDVVVLFNDSSEVVNLLTKDRKVALYELNCEYPCSVCNFNVDDDGERGQGLECSICESWFHNSCTDNPISSEFYDILTDSPGFIKICCPPCSKNGQVKKLYNKLNKVEIGLKDELACVKDLVTNKIGNSNNYLSQFTDIVVNSLKDEIKHLIKSELGCLKTAIKADLDSISDNTRSQKESISTIKAEVGSLNGQLVGNANALVDGIQQNVTTLIKEIKNAEDTIENLKDSTIEATDRVKDLGIDTSKNAEAFEAALNRVVDNAERLHRIDIDVISENVMKSSETIQQQFSQNVLPKAMETLTSKLEAATVNPCSGKCATNIETKIDKIINSMSSHKNPDLFSRPSSAASSVFPSTSDSSWSTAVSKSGPSLRNGTVTSSPKLKGRNMRESSSPKLSMQTNLEMDMTKTITIGNVKDASISNSARIKSVFNKCFPRMEIVHCKRAINGFILVEVDTAENAKKVVTSWDGSKFFKCGSESSDNTYAQILEDARAKSIIEDVDKELTDEFLTKELEKTFPNASAKRFKNKYGPTHVVLLTFASKADQEKASKDKILIGNAIFRTKPYETRKRLTQCYQCFSFNHIARNCQKARVCPYCCGNHEEKQCVIKEKKETEKYVCINCRGNHSALFKECEVYKKFAHTRSNNDD